jgi:hypothetical protein
LASTQPIQVASIQTIEARLPPAAAEDLREWVPGRNLELGIRTLTVYEIPLSGLLPADRPAMVTDDHPYNEYYYLRRLVDYWRHQQMNAW